MKKYITFPVTLILVSFFTFRSSAQTISAGLNYSLMVCNDNTVKAWGRNVYGVLGNGTTTDSNSPVQVNGISTAIAVSAGDTHCMALLNNGTVMTWGDNYAGELGNGTTTFSHVPIQVLSLSGIIAIDAGNGHSLALKNDGTVWAWGMNLYGELGNGTHSNSTVRVQVSNLTNIIAIAAGDYFCMALKNDGTVWAWGKNTYGQLGIGTTGDTTLPVQVSNLTGIVSIATSGESYASGHTLAIKNDGTVWAWGRNDYGQLGNGTNIDSNIPVQVSNLTGITAIAAGGTPITFASPGYGFSAVVKNDGTVWAFGSNFYGQLGNGTNASTNVPIQVFSLTGVTNISAGGWHLMTLKNDGTVSACGFNILGQLGNGNNIDSNIPVLVNSLCPALNLEKIESETSQLSVYPNPSVGIFQVTVKNLNNSQWKLDVYNLFGEKIFSEVNENENSEIDLSKQAKGIYFIRIHQNNCNLIGSKTIIIN